MGIVIRQAFKSTIYSYIGAGLGFLTVWFMNRLWLTPEQNGLLNILISISLISGSLVNLGMAGVATRLFPHLRDSENNHHGFLMKAMLTTTIGFVLFAAVYWLTRDAIVARNEAKSALFAQHTELLLPLTIFIGAFYILDAYSRSIFQSTIGVIVKEVGLRIVILAAAVAYHWNIIDFESFVWIYCGSFCSMSVAMLIYLWRDRSLAWGKSSKKMSPELKREVIWVAGFSVLTGLSSLLISSIDKIIVNDRLGLAAAGIFSVATYFGSIIQIPARSIVRIASGVIAESWKNNDTANILDIYKKTCLNQFIIGSFLFIAICGNLDLLVGLLPVEYAEAKYVIFWMGLGYLIDMATGANGVLIGTSSKYKYDTYFMLLLVVFTFTTNWILIPKLGITGAAVASCSTFAIYNFLRFLFIWRVFGMQPYDRKMLVALMIAAFSALVLWLVPTVSNAYISIALRIGVFSLVFGLLLYYSKVSEDMNKVIQRFRG